MSERSYTDSQREAINWGEGPVIVLAGPGSGKTMVLTERIIRILKESEEDSFRILALTFTNKAAAEMSERIEKGLGRAEKRLFAGTFHSFCSAVLRKLGVAEIVRFTPSACNTQPWIVENNSSDLMVYRYKKPGKRGIMPVKKVRYYNKIDIGIFLFILETCLEHENYIYDRVLFADISNDSIEQTLIAKYTYSSK